jgi:peptide/nickel transport system ATP-binding protein
MDKPLLTVEDLNITFGSGNHTVRAVRGVSFTVGREKVGIVGESGSGKSQTGRAIMRLSPGQVKVEARKLDFDGIALLEQSERQMRDIRGNRISMILQDPKFSLNPLIRVGDQVIEAYRVHHKVGRTEAREKALAMLDAVHIRDPERVFKLYPHEVSGGMGQRIMIAMMLIPEPDLIIADEPTSALDVTVRRQVLAILDELLEKRRAGLLFISHDLNLVGDFCDRVLVMYAGRIVEDIPARDLHRAQHPYTRGLLDSLPRLDKRSDTLSTLQRDPAWLNAPTIVHGG